MPRVYTKKKSTRGKPINCVRCGNRVEAGQEFYEWSFRYGGTHNQHVSHGHPRPSQLTQSKMSQAHAACEDLEDSLRDGSLDTTDDIADAVQTCMDALQEVMDEYEEAINNMPASEEQNRERIDMLQETYDALDNAKDYNGDDLEEEDSEDDEEEAQRKADENDARLTTYRDEILDAVGSRSF